MVLHVARIWQLWFLACTEAVKGGPTDNVHKRQSCPASEGGSAKLLLCATARSCRGTTSPSKLPACCSNIHVSLMSATLSLIIHD